MIVGIMFLCSSSLALDHPVHSTADEVTSGDRDKNVLVEDLFVLYKRALQSDPQLCAARFEYEAACEVMPQAVAGLLPEVLGSVERIRSHQSIVSSDNEVFASGSTAFSTQTEILTIKQTVFDWQAFVGVAQARVDLRRAVVAFEQARQDLIIRVCERYMTLLLADDRLAFVRAEISAVESDFALAEGRHSMGLAPVTDLLDARARLAAVRAAEIDAYNQFLDARQAMEEVCGYISNDQAGLQRTIPMIGPQPAKLELWITAAQDQNLEIQLQRHVVEVARQEVNRQRAGHLPTLEAVGTYNRQDTDGTLFGGGSDVKTRDIGLRMSLPLFEGGKILSLSRQASNLYRAALMNQEKVLRAVERETRAAYLGVEAAISRAAALEQSLKAQKLVVEAKQEGFSSGLHTSLAVLDAQRDLYRTRKEYAEARYDYIINSMRLRRTIGTLNENDLIMINQWLIPADTADKD